VHPVFDLVESLCEVLDGQGLTEMSAPFVPPSVAFASGVLVGVSLVCGVHWQTTRLLRYPRDIG
jgi:hypothetical protein